MIRTTNWRNMTKETIFKVVHKCYTIVRAAFADSEDFWINNTMDISLKRIAEANSNCGKNQVAILTTGALSEPISLRIKCAESSCCSVELLNMVNVSVVEYFSTRTEFKNSHNGRSWFYFVMSSYLIQK